MIDAGAAASSSKSRRRGARAGGQVARWSVLPVLMLLVVARSACGAASTDASRRREAELSGTLPDGALWRVHVPSHWNGTLILYSHGYLPDVRPPALAPTGMESWLLEHGYALGASSYAHGGWAVADAIPDQLETVSIFKARVATPQHIIAWGESMGGLVTVALAERADSPLDGALSACGSIAGSLEMMNQALDGAFAFTTLAAPHAGIRVVDTTDDHANAARVSAALREVLGTPQGRARVALAAALAGLPVWTPPGSAEPAPEDYAGQLTQVAHSFVAGVFLPRAEQERVAHGVFSWNTDTDYRDRLARSGRRAWVEHYYREAGVVLEEDLNALNAAPRVHANPLAVDYMRANYVPSGTPRVPLMSYHTLGDGLTSPDLQLTYSRKVDRNAAAARNFQAAWIRASGHCTFSSGEHVAALRTLEHRLRSGRWEAQPENLNALVATEKLGIGRFVPFRRAEIFP
jgi:hypothetical protein